MQRRGKRTARKMRLECQQCPDDDADDRVEQQMSEFTGVFFDFFAVFVQPCRCPSANFIRVETGNDAVQFLYPVASGIETLRQLLKYARDVVGAHKYHQDNHRGGGEREQDGADDQQQRDDFGAFIRQALALNLSGDPVNNRMDKKTGHQRGEHVKLQASGAGQVR